MNRRCPAASTRCSLPGKPLSRSEQLQRVLLPVLARGSSREANLGPFPAGPPEMWAQLPVHESMLRFFAFHVRLGVPICVDVPESASRASRNAPQDLLSYRLDGPRYRSPACHRFRENSGIYPMLRG